MKINNVKLTISAVRMSQFPDDNKEELLLVGRSNVGKSSFINAIIDRKNYARTSSTPGKTQTLNFYLINNNFYLIDVPGYGFAKVSKQLKAKFGLMIEEYLESRTNLKAVFLLVDFRHKPTADDKIMYEYLKYHNKKVYVIATKADKIAKSKHLKHINMIISTLGIKEKEELIVFSSITKQGRENIYQIIDNIIPNDSPVA
ncbi:MAG: ribosome biogenesis GTP-binding protein YihA/YsxC [bacterium]|nr:ribosome biogenesis GTP-binding protein YihA/YsxC [bacterium]